MGGEIDIPYFAIMNMAVVVQRVVGITMNLKQSKHGTSVCHNERQQCKGWNGRRNANQ